MAFDNAFIVFGSHSVHEPDALSRILVFLSLMALFATCLLYTVVFRNPSIEIPAGYVIAATFWGIFEQQRTDFIHVSALVFLILTSIWLGVRVVMFGWFDRTGERLPEEEPLLRGDSTPENEP
jgi:hypothetical protein